MQKPLSTFHFHTNANLYFMYCIMVHVPCLSRNSLEPFASQILIPFLFNSFALVHPLTNHRSSSATPRQNTRFVVRRGIMLSRRLNLICVPKTEIVPVPKKLKIYTLITLLSNFFIKICNLGDQGGASWGDSIIMVKS